MVELVNRVGLENAPSACATVGLVEVHPNSRNVIPGRVFLTIDLRHPDDETLLRMDKALRDGIAAAAKDIGLEVELEEIWYSAPVHFDDRCIDAVRAATTVCGHSQRDMVSGAGHDACYLARVAPTSMIFVPCVDGISHNEIEDAKPEWITAGADVLLHAMLREADAVE